MTMFDGITEFTYIDPEEMHLVSRAANGVESPLLAKAAEALEEEYDAFIKKFVDGICEVPFCDVCHERLRVLKSDDRQMEKAKLKAKQRNALDDSDFALSGRRYPIHDEAHARNALSRGAANATPEELKEIKRKVHAKFPNIEIDGGNDNAAKEAGMECDTCHGSGKADEDEGSCKVCKGSGQMPSVGDTAKQTAPDKSVPKDEALSQTHEVSQDVGAGSSEEPEDGGTPKHQEMAAEKPPQGDGEGDTAPEKEAPKGEALSQTNDDIGGTAKGMGNEIHAHLEDAEGALTEAKVDTAYESGKHKGEQEASKAAPFVSMSGTSGGGDTAPGDTTGALAGGQEADSKPGSSAWETKDAMLAEVASHLILRANEMIELLGNRERAEKALSADGEKALRTQMQGLCKTLESATIVSKETEDMTNDELIKFLDERDEAARRLEKANAKATAKKAAKKAKKADKKMKMKDTEPDGDDDMTAKAAQAVKAASEVTSGKVTKAELIKTVAGLSDLVEKIAAEPGHRPMINDAGIGAGAAKPVFRGIEAGSDDPRAAFKELDDEIAALDERVRKGDDTARVQRDQKRSELTRGLMIANERARKANPGLETSPFPDSAQILTNRHALPEDSGISGLNGRRMTGAARR